MNSTAASDRQREALAHLLKRNRLWDRLLMPESGALLGRLWTTVDDVEAKRLLAHVMQGPPGDEDEDEDEEERSRPLHRASTPCPRQRDALSHGRGRPTGAGPFAAIKPQFLSTLCEHAAEVLASEDMLFHFIMVAALKLPNSIEIMEARDILAAAGEAGRRSAAL